MSLQDVVRYLNVRNRVRYPELPGSGEALELVDGRVIARFLELALTSHFLPVSELARGRVVGHGAQVVPSSRPSAPFSSDVLFARSRHDDEVVFLDRLCRTIHALNFVERNLGSQLLLLEVSPRHLLAVHDHGTVFEAILGQVHLAPSQVVILVDPEHCGPGTLRSAFRNFQSRGFRLALDHFGRGSSNYDRLVALEPEFVRLDAEVVPLAERDPRSRGALARLIELGRSHGAKVVLPGVDDERRVELAREAGADWIQGELALGRASDRPPSRGSERPSRGSECAPSRGAERPIARGADRALARGSEGSGDVGEALSGEGSREPSGARREHSGEEAPGSGERLRPIYEEFADENETTRVDRVLAR